MSGKRAYSVAEAAAELGIGRTLAYSLVASGELRTIKLGTRRIVPADAIDELLAKEGACGQPNG